MPHSFLFMIFKSFMVIQAAVHRVICDGWRTNIGPGTDIRPAYGAISQTFCRDEVFLIDDKLLHFLEQGLPA